MRLTPVRWVSALCGPLGGGRLQPEDSKGKGRLRVGASLALDSSPFSGEAGPSGLEESHSDENQSRIERKKGSLGAAAFVDGPLAARGCKTPSSRSPLHLVGGLARKSEPLGPGQGLGIASNSLSPSLLFPKPLF